MIPYLLGLATLPTIVLVWLVVRCLQDSYRVGNWRRAWRLLTFADHSARVWTAPAWKEGARRAGRIAYRRASAAYVAEIANRARWRGRWLTPVPLAFFHLWPTLRMVATVLMRDDFHPGESMIGRWERRA